MGTVIAFRNPRTSVDCPPLNMRELEKLTAHIIKNISGELYVVSSGIERPSGEKDLHYYFDIGSDTQVEVRMYLSVEESRKILTLCVDQ